MTHTSRVTAMFLIMLVAPVMAAAQEAPLDSGAVSACFDATPRGQTDPACIGQPADACQMSHEQPQTTLAISQCLMAEAAAWDRLLNREYMARRADHADAPELAELLLQAQRGWIAMRDADCSLAYDQFGGGSMRLISGADCRLRHTAWRSLQLRDMRWGE
ncbi:lysozyme inhibitor LprI family protein [Paracoccus salsus]|uniref:lysozyme inhibitor LprI family protein n=1 Tax=Paracoccus salsus TaxID=2911061 RepID=UPI001F3433AA|nr:lysozyme inhibitor LprI family protein [Paracoccus salsus]MCF3972141.1 lysozyme inhibitor LprI family protein [Paracoccus salsus]